MNGCCGGRSKIPSRPNVGGGPKNFFRRVSSKFIWLTPVLVLLTLNFFYGAGRRDQNYGSPAALAKSKGMTMRALTPVELKKKSLKATTNDSVNEIARTPLRKAAAPIFPDFRQNSSTAGTSFSVDPLMNWDNFKYQSNMLRNVESLRDRFDGLHVKGEVRF